MNWMLFGEWLNMQFGTFRRGAIVAQIMRDRRKPPHTPNVGD